MPSTQPITPIYNLTPILLVNFIGTLGYSIVLPFLVILVTDFGGNEIIYGVMGATYSFFQLIGAPVLGRWSDKIGRRKILIFSQAGTFIAWAIFLVALIIPNNSIFDINSQWLGLFTLTVPLVLLFVARALDGLTGGNVSVANAYLSDISTDENRKANFGKMAASANMGMIIGPAMAGLLGSTVLGNIVPIIAAMTISGLAIMVIQFKLKESNPCDMDGPSEIAGNRKVLGQELKECHEISGDLTLKDVLKLDRIPLLLTLYFLIFLAFNFFYVSFPMHAVTQLKWTVFDMGIFFSIMSGLMVLVQGPILSWISKFTSESILIISGNLFLIFGFGLFKFESQAMIYTGLAMFSIGNGIMWPSFLSVLSSAAKKEFQGAVQGFASSTGSLASIIGLLAGGFIYQGFGENIFLVPAGLMILIFFVCLPLLRKT